jgi:hypothetical protein
MHVPSATVNAEVGEAKAQSFAYVVLLAATTAISGFLFGFDTAVINGVLFLHLQSTPRFPAFAVFSCGRWFLRRKVARSNRFNRRGASGTGSLSS